MSRPKSTTQKPLLLLKPGLLERELSMLTVRLLCFPSQTFYVARFFLGINFLCAILPPPRRAFEICPLPFGDWICSLFFFQIIVSHLKSKVEVTIVLLSFNIVPVDHAEVLTNVFKNLYTLFRFVQFSFV